MTIYAKAYRLGKRAFNRSTANPYLTGETHNHVLAAHWGYGFADAKWIAELNKEKGYVAERYNSEEAQRLDANRPEGRPRGGVSTDVP